MRLKSITLTGFKSFVDRTRVDFPSQITAIVGPNGCGKSNTIDAVRWVMGESSAKYLRGASMADVIFNGSVHRAPLGQASIELHFENTAGRLGGLYNSYEELMIRRQIMRDGQSNYYLNNARCRRKDITDIFLGTGLGPRSYAIIEQGTISRLIEAKPEDLRVFLEEAAGISRYKERRKETQQRIEHTRENLLRVFDVREELAKQVAHLEHQAKLAEKYKKYKAEERLLRAQLFVFRYQALQQEYAHHQATLDSLQTEIASYEDKNSTFNAQLQAQFDLQQESQKALEQYQEQYNEITKAVSVCAEKIQHNRTQQEQSSYSLKQLLQQRKEAEHLDTLDKSSLAQLTASLLQLQTELTEQETLLTQQEDAYRQASSAQKNWQTQWQELNTQLAKHTQTAQVEQTRIQHVEQRLQQLKNQQQKLQEEQATLTTEADTRDYDALQASLQALNAEYEEHHRCVLKYNEALQHDRLQQQALIKKLNEVRHERQQLEGKAAALETLQQQALGNQEQHIKAWLEKHQLNDHQRLANSIEVDAAFEPHLEHYLGEQLQAVAIKDFSTLVNALSDFPKGHLSFIHDTNIDHTTSLNSPPSTLASKVKGPQALLETLAHVYCAEQLSDALSIINTLPENAEIITADGFLVQRHWIQIRRGKNEQSGILQRKREIAALQILRAELSTQLQTIEQEQTQLELRIKETETLKQHAQQDCQQVDLKKNQTQAQAHIQQAKIEQKQNRLQKLTQEINATLNEATQLEAQYTHARTLWQTALDQLNQHQQQKDQLTEQKNNLEKALHEAGQLLRAKQEIVQQLKMKQQKFSTEQQGLNSQQNRMKQQFQQLTDRQNTLTEHLATLAPELSALEIQLASLKQKEAEYTTQLDNTKTKLTEDAQHLRTIETERQKLREQLETLKETYTRHQIHAEHAQTKSSGILEQFSECDLIFTEVAEQLPESFSETESQNLLEQTQHRIQRLGAINLAAISECAETLERKTFFDTQYDDLTIALNTLESAIREIDKETTAKFQATFDTVNNNFKALFPKIFGGGQAYLSLTSDDLLETGAMVFAQPPGKRNSTIHLLSGGEKALTALALIFAIFELNPSPFCMLDEVDAPLDDVNVGRFCHLVQAMAKKTQFIVVTHNKVAMEMADHLMGVTMQEPGVSRLVAVDVEAAMAMAT